MHASPDCNALTPKLALTASAWPFASIDRVCSWRRSTNLSRNGAEDGVAVWPRCYYPAAFCRTGNRQPDRAKWQVYPCG